jgi:hypothetical protein
MSTLTPEQVNKGRMVAAAYEVDYQVNREMASSGSTMQEATDTVLLQQHNILRQTELSDYRVIENLSDKQYLVLEKGNEVKVVFRGRAGNTNPVRPPANSIEHMLSEGDSMAGIDTIHVADTLKGTTRDYTYIDDLMGELQLTRPDANVEVISYSNGGPKGLYMSEKYGLPHHSIDPVLGPKEVALLAKRGPDSAPLDLVRTNRPALASGMGQTAQQILTGDEAHINTINVAPVKSEGHPLAKIVDAHDLSHYALMDDQLNVIPETHRGKVGIIGKNALGSVVSGVAPAALASVLVEGTTPDAPREAKIVEEAAATSIITKGVSPMLGAGAAPIAESILPLYASFEAADKTGQLADKIIPDDMHGVHNTVKGALGGAAGGAAFAGTAAVQTAAVTTLLGAEAGAEAGSVLAPETFGLSILAGAALGGTVGLITDIFSKHDQKEPIPLVPREYTKKEHDEYMVQRQETNRYFELQQMQATPTTKWTEADRQDVQLYNTKIKGGWRPSH